MKDTERAAKYLEWAADRVMGDFYRESVEMRELAAGLRVGEAVATSAPLSIETLRRVVPPDVYKTYAPGTDYCARCDGWHEPPACNAVDDRLDVAQLDLTAAKVRAEAQPHTIQPPRRPRRVG